MSYNDKHPTPIGPTLEGSEKKPKKESKNAGETLAETSNLLYDGKIAALAKSKKMLKSPKVPADLHRPHADTHGILLHDDTDTIGPAVTIHITSPGTTPGDSG